MANVSRLEIQTHDLVCPVCLLVPRCRIYQCTNGHSVCSSCQSSCQGKCPTCRVNFGATNIRSLFHENVIDSNFTVRCKWCNAKVPSTKLESHEKSCPMSTVFTSKFRMIVDDLQSMLIVKKRAQVVEYLSEYCVEKNQGIQQRRKLLEKVAQVALFSLVKSYPIAFRRCEGKMENVNILVLGPGNCNLSLLTSSSCGIQLFSLPCEKDTSSHTFLSQLSDFVRSNRRCIVCVIVQEKFLDTAEIHHLCKLRQSNVIYLAQKHVASEHVYDLMKRFVFEDSTCALTEDSSTSVVVKSTRFYHIDCRWYIIDSLISICRLTNVSDQVLFLKDMSRRLCLNTNIANNLAKQVL